MVRLKPLLPPLTIAPSVLQYEFHNRYAFLDDAIGKLYKMIMNRVRVTRLARMVNRTTVVTK